MINRLPTPSLHFSSPWEILFGQKPEYSQFKTFRCSCFPLLRPYNQHKSQFRSAECVFLGYTTHSKGYLCVDLSSNKLDTSRHVFYETYFPYHTSISPKDTAPPSQSPMNTWISSLLYFITFHNPSILGPAPNPNPSLTTPSILGPPPCPVEPQPLSNVHCPIGPSPAT